MSVSENIITLPLLASREEDAASRSIPKALRNAAARLVDSLKVNSVCEKTRRRRRLMIKQRNGYSEPLGKLANIYFRMAGIPIRFWVKTKEWQQWEVNCFNMLNGDRFRAWVCGDKTVCAHKLPGKSLWDHLNEGTLTQKNDRDGRSRIATRASIPEQRISGSVVARRRRNEQCDLRPQNRAGPID